MRKIWSGIRSIINASKGKADYIPTLLENGKLIDNPSAIARTFNTFFVNVGKNTDKDISPGSYCPTSFLKGNFPDSMFLAPVTSNKVESYGKSKESDPTDASANTSANAFVDTLSTCSLTHYRHVF